MSETWIQLMAAASIPSALFSAVVGLVVWRFKRMQEKKDKAQAQKDNSIIEFFAMSIKATNASIAMGEAIGTAVARIPDAHCNGDMHKALEHANKIKHEMREYITNQGVHHIFDD